MTWPVTWPAMLRGANARTELLHRPPRALYAYLVYGLQWLLNIVQGREQIFAIF